MDRSILLPVGALLLAILSLCVGTSFAKQLFSVVGAQGTTAMRVGFAALILLAIWRPWRIPLDRSQARLILLYGLILGAMNLMFYMALRTVPLGLAIAIEFTGPLAVAVAGSRRWTDILWVALAAGGLLLLLPITPGPALDPVGVTFALGAAVCWALYILTGSRVGRGHYGQATSLGMATAALAVLPFGLAAGGGALFTPEVLAVGLVVAVMSSALPYSLEMYALSRLPRPTFGILMSLEPAVGAMAGFVILDERLTPLQLLAIAAIVAASVGAARAAQARNSALRDSAPPPNNVPTA